MAISEQSRDDRFVRFIAKHRQLAWNWFTIAVISLSWFETDSRRRSPLTKRSIERDARVTLLSWQLLPIRTIWNGGMALGDTGFQS